MTNDSWLSGCGTAWYASARCREASDDASPSMACSTKLSKRTNQPTRRVWQTYQPTNWQRKAHTSQVRPTKPHYASCNVTNYTLENPAAWIVSTVWIFIHVRHIFQTICKNLERHLKTYSLVPILETANSVMKMVWWLSKSTATKYSGTLAGHWCCFHVSLQLEEKYGAMGLISFSKIQHHITCHYQ